MHRNEVEVKTYGEHWNPRVGRQSVAHSEKHKPRSPLHLGDTEALFYLMELALTGPGTCFA